MTKQNTEVIQGVAAADDLDLLYYTIIKEYDPLSFYISTVVENFAWTNVFAFQRNLTARTMEKRSVWITTVIAYYIDIITVTIITNLGNFINSVSRIADPVCWFVITLLDPLWKKHSTPLLTKTVLWSGIYDHFPSEVCLWTKYLT